MLQYKRRKGITETVVSTPLQKLTNLVADKQHPVLDGLFHLVSQLLIHRRSTRCTANEASQQVKALAAMVPGIGGAVISPEGLKK